MCSFLFGFIFDVRTWLLTNRFWFTLNIEPDIVRTVIFLSIVSKGKCKLVPLQSRKGPEGSGKLRFPDLMTTAQDVGKVVSPTHRPPLPPGNAPGTHFC